MQLRRLLFVLGMIPALASAQSQIKIDFSSEGEREIWVSDKMALPASTMKSTQSTLVVPRQGGAQDRLFVWDRKSGNVAAKPINLLKDNWKLAAGDFRWIGRLTIQLEHDGKPVKAAIVDLKNSEGTRKVIVDAASNGKAVFFGVGAGNAEANVQYTSNAQPESAVQKFTVSLDRSEPDPVIAITLSKPVETIEAANPEAGAGGQPKPDVAKEAAPDSSPRGSIIGNIFVYLLGLAAAGALIYFGLRYLKQNEGKVKDQLQKVGVQIPEPADDDPIPAPVPVAPAPPQKILLDDADPNIPPSAPVAISRSPVSQPSLVMANGDIFTLPEGETTVGREAGNGLSLVTESTVSRRHATIVKEGLDVVIRDEGSSNGTFVNGVKIASDTALHPGDQLQFGEAKLRFEG